MKSITSIHNPIVNHLRALKTSKHRTEHQQFVVEGWHLVASALAAHAVVSIFVVVDEIKKFPQLAASNNEIYLITHDILKKVSQNVTPQPIIALCQIPPVNHETSENIVVLDNIQDPSNLGAILRSCAAFGINQVLLSNNSVDVYNHKVINASQGAIFRVNTKYCDLVTAINQLKHDNYYVYGTFLHENHAASLDQLTFKSRNVLIFGNEGQGISQSLRPLIDENFVITTTDQVESLNLAISLAITLYTLFNFKI